MFRGFGKKDKSKASKTAKASPSSTQTSADPSHAPKTDGAVRSRSSSGNGAGQAGSQASVHSTGRFEKMTLLTVVSLKDVSAAEQPMLFRRHLKLCCKCFNFEDRLDMKEKEAKRLVLLGLVDYISNPITQISESDFPAVLQMVSANMFRSLPPQSDLVLDEEDEPTQEPSWPHLQVVYEFLLRFIVSGNVDPKQLKKHITHAFILKLLRIFDSEDSRERDYLKTILHRIYGKIMALRVFIRRAITDVFLGVIYLDDQHNGIAQLLEILGSIINGFALPLKAEHKQFLSKVLVPLHKVWDISTFNQQLEYCVTQFVEKDSKMAEPLILGLLRYWPETNSIKQVQFLKELGEILDFTQQEEFRKVLEPLFKRLALCLKSQHFQVAERTLLLWNNEYLFTLMTLNRAKILPILYDVLQQNALDHWNSNVKVLSQNVLSSFQKVDRSLYMRVAAEAEENSRQKDKEEQSRAIIWKQISPDEELEAAIESLSLEPPAPPVEQTEPAKAVMPK
mmetsp:Transcript_9486/g.16612  ORF Transcript_9486/g.16612 Transcript_9486/m.16612 type:complete len:508 (-) Transcript_9486:29-1552(-)